MENSSVREDQLRVIMADCDNLLQLGRGGRGGLVQKSGWKGEREGGRMRKRERKEREGSKRHKKRQIFIQWYKCIAVHCIIHVHCTHMYTPYQWHWLAFPVSTDRLWCAQVGGLSAQKPRPQNLNRELTWRPFTYYTKIIYSSDDPLPITISWSGKGR